MVANAGVIAPKTIVEISPDEFDRVLAVSFDVLYSEVFLSDTVEINTRGAFLCYREAGKSQPPEKHDTTKLQTNLGCQLSR